MSSWLLDAERGECLKADGDQIECAGAPDQAINALLDSSLLCLSRPARYHVQFDCDLQEGSLFVGLTTKGAFKPGYGIKGYFFGGNLSDGSCLLVGGFGRAIRGQTKVSLLIDLSAEELRIYVVQDGRPLGLAFQVRQPVQLPLLPAVQFNGAGRVRVQAAPVVAMDGLLQRRELDTTTIVGLWELDNFCRDGQRHTLQAAYRLHVRADGDELQLTIKVVNSVGGLFSVDLAAGKLELVESLFSTMMAGPPQMMEDERMLGAALARLAGFRLENQAQLLLLTGDGFEMQLRRFVETFEPVREDPTRG